MKKYLTTIALMMTVAAGHAQTEQENPLERNKRLARAFYEDLWFSNNTGNYGLYVADDYVVHDIGDQKNITEPAIEQKNIADFFWDNGDMSGQIDFQIADRDLVATRWTWEFEPTTLLGRVLKGQDNVPIINVFRFEDGKIVEVWNHRHDIDTGMTVRYVAQGLLIGLLVALVPFVWAISLRRRLKRALSAAGQG